MPSISGTSVVSGALRSTLNEAEEYSRKLGRCKVGKSKRKVSRRVQEATKIGTVGQQQPCREPGFSSLQSMSENSADVTNISSLEESSSSSSVHSEVLSGDGADQNLLARPNLESVSTEEALAFRDVVNEYSGSSSSSTDSKVSSLDLGIECSSTQTYTELRPPSVIREHTIDSSVLEKPPQQCSSSCCTNAVDDQTDAGEISYHNSESSARTLGFSLEDLRKWKIKNERKEKTKVSSTSHTMPERKNRESSFAQLDEPKIILFDREKVQPGWKDKMPIGCGFINLGNSCYLNATLQALFHTPAFINWLLGDEEHRQQCQSNSQSVHQCIICPMASTAFEAYYESNQSIRPILIHDKLKHIGRSLTSGRQEDAHEFMRLLLESMEDSYLTAVNGHRLDSRSKETTPLGQIFGGYYRDEVTCLKCHFVSTTFHPQAELQLDIRNVSSIEDGIMLHFKRESLENNDYRCEKCSTIEPATKQHFLEMAPIVLCVQLKRFRQHGTKITKPIHINRTLNLKQYIHPLSPDSESDASYRLVGLISHIGTSPNCGHYTAIAEAQNGMFYHFDDSYVRLTNLTCAQNSDAYVVIYEMNQNPVLPVNRTESFSTTSECEDLTRNEVIDEDNCESTCVPAADNITLQSQGTTVKQCLSLPVSSVFPRSQPSERWEGTTSLYGMTVDEIIDRWCTPSRSHNLSEYSFPKETSSKQLTLSMDVNRNQVVVSDRKRYLTKIEDNLGGDCCEKNMEKKAKIVSESAAAECPETVLEGASTGDESSTEEDLKK